MQLKNFTGKPCRARVAYEFLPNKKMKLKLSEIEKNIEEKFEIEVKSKILLIIRVEDKTVSLFESGKLLVRGEREEAGAKEIAKKIVKLIPSN